MITAADLEADFAGKRVRKMHKEACRKALAEFNACDLALSQAEREGCLRAILDDPRGAYACYRAIRVSQ